MKGAGALRDLRLLTWARLRMSAHRLAGLRSHSRLKLIVVFLFAAGLWALLFFLFRSGFGFLGIYPEVKGRIQEIGFGLFYFALAQMLILSNAVIAYGVFYRGRESVFLLTLPARAEHLFTVQFFEILGFSSWALLFLAVPMLAAYAREEGLGGAFLPCAVALLAVFTLIPAGLGALLASAAALLGPRRIDLRAFAALAALGGGAALVAGRTLLDWKKQEDQLDAAWLFGLMDSLAFLDHPLLPTQWLTRGIFALARGEWAEALYQAASLGTTAAALFTLGYVGAWLWHRRAAARVAASAGGARPRAESRLDHLLSPLLRPFFAPQSRLLLLKDLKTFLRDPAQWSQGLIFFGLLGIYFLNLRQLAYPFGDHYWKNLVAFLNLSATCLTLSTFTGRFVFPLVSLEGRRFWVLGLMPMSRRTLLWGKFWFACLGGITVAGVLITVSDSMLQVPVPMAMVHAYALVVICAGLAGLAVGLGAAFPNFKEDSPSKIVSGFGGTLNLVLSLGFMVAVILLEAIPCHLYYAVGKMGWVDFRRLILGCSLGVLVLGGLTVMIPMRMGLRAFRRMDL